MRFLVGPNGRARSRRRLMAESLEKRELLTTLQVTEINYNPYLPVAEYGDVGEKDEFTFIELANTGRETINLTGIRFVDGVDFIFGEGNLEPDERIVVVENLQSFQSRYGTNVDIAGVWSGNLDEKGEVLKLVEADGVTVIQEFEYDDDGAWPNRADGRGSTLELKDINGDPDKAGTWRSSRAFGGTPGFAPPPDVNIVINEVLAHTDLPQVDTIELYNPTDVAVDISHWYLSDFDSQNFDPETDTLESLTKFKIDAGTEIPAKGYAVFDESHFNRGQGVNDNDFALSEFGDEVWLVAGDSGRRPTQFVDDISFGANLNGISLGLLPNGNSRSDMLPLGELSLGSENQSQWKSPVVIEEVHYFPSGNDVSLEFIELANASNEFQDLDDWRIEDAVEFVFPEGTRLGDERIVLVSFDPSDNSMAAPFRDAYGMDPSVRLFGPWGADEDGVPRRLSNGGEKITLMAPTMDIAGTFYHIADQVDYDNDNPWPIAADGFGGSLDRTSSNAFGNDPASWRSATPSPGSEMQSEFSLHNEAEPLDVDGSGQIVAFDVLQVINYLNGENVTLRPVYLDVNDDNVISPFDALQIINHLNDPPAQAARAASSEAAVGGALDVDDEEVSGEAPVVAETVASADLESKKKRTGDWISQVESLFKS